MKYSIHPRKIGAARVVACFWVSIQSLPGHTGNCRAPNRRVGIAGAGGVVATGTLLWALLMPQAWAQQGLVKDGQTTRQNASALKQTEPGSAAEVCQLQEGAGPEMIVIAAGSFQQGSPKTETGRYSYESPRHKVTIQKPFAISRCEVTVGEFRRFVEATGYSTDAEESGGCFAWDREAKQWKQNKRFYWGSPGFEHSEQHPVTCVSWQDAKAYIDWLNESLGLPDDTYRLPIESEWEYAARAGTEGAVYWGNDSQCDFANRADQTLKDSGVFSAGGDYANCQDGFVYTAPVARFKANIWEIHDMLGNVWEWVQDCWHDSYQGAPVDGSVWLGSEEECKRRSVRGGGWSGRPRSLRAANRSGLRADDADSSGGFRLARTL